MKSPFPGMDPYIEACGLWEDFHGHLIQKIYESVASDLPEGYFAQTGTRAYVVVAGSEGKREHLLKPDVGVAEAAGKKRPRRPRSSVAVAESEEPVEPVEMRPFIAEEFRESFVEIYAQEEDRVLVTCVEVLSPSNKRPNTEGWREYARKRQAMLLGRANFIELDLLRGGQKMPMLEEWPESPYSLLVSRADHAPSCRVWPGSFRRRLPVIPVPLVSPDPPLSLDLQPLIDGIYQLARYDRQLDYSRPLKPTLRKPDATWVRERIETHRRAR
jgi:hypothetical protein